MKLTNGVDDHDHIVARLYVSRWRDGTIKDRQIVLESTEIANAIRDYWIDATFKVGGATQATWTDKYLTAHTSARWSQTKPFGMCTAGDFMRGRLILPWGRSPSADNNAKAAAKLRGGVCNRSWYWTDTSQTADLGGYVNASVNEPFWPIPWNWSRTGGARPELGLNNSYESLFWKGNTMVNWPMALAMADNGISAHPFQHRDESPPANAYLDPADHADAAPNLYTRWNYRTAVYTTGKPRGAGPTVITQPYHLGRYMENLASTASHHPSPGIYNAYIIQPEKRYFDLQEMFTWYFQEHPESGAGATGNPASEAVGGPTHHLAYEPANGNRSFAWPWREIARMAFMTWDGHPRRDYWRRVNQDMCDHYNASADKTYWGAFHSRGYPLSTADETNPTPRTLEANWRDGLLNMNAGAPEYPTSLSADDGLSFFKNYDGFKGAFVNFVALQCKDLNSGNIASGLAKNVWQVRVLKTNPDQARWFMLAGSGWYICKDLVLSGSNFVSATHPNGYRPWDDETGADLWAWISANEANLTGFAGLKTTTAAVLADLDYTPGYSFVKGTQVGLLLQARHGAGEDKTDAQSYFNLVNSTWSRAATRGSYESVNYTYADWFMQLDVVADSDVVD